MASLEGGTNSISCEQSPIVNLGKQSPAGSKTPDSVSGCYSPGSPIRDDACPICLGSITDKCVAGSCFHNFCFVCLKEWSKQKAVCPLCKQPFTKIIYNIKSETDYKEYIVPRIVPYQFATVASNGRNIRNILEYEFTNFFDLSRRRRTPHYIQNTGILPNAPRGEMVTRSQHRGSSLFRLSVYLNNVWVQPLADITGQYRESSPDLYREMPALTHRLVPWINREVAALLPASRVSVVLVEIMDLIERYPINSREFRNAIRPHFGSRTRHFTHEFYNFARSPYDMVGHDNAARYVPHYELENENLSESEDDDIIEVELNGEPVEPLDLSLRPAIEEVLANDGSVVISSGNSSSDDEDDHHYRELFSETHNPQPPPPIFRNSRRGTSAFERIYSRHETRDTHLEEPGPSGISSNGSITGSISVKRESRDICGESSDDCEIVSILKPKKERTPEIINLSSSSESERTKSKSKTHWKKKISKQVERKSDSKKNKRPRLDRTSFSLHISGTLDCTDRECSLSGSSSAAQRQHSEDHNYCTGSGSNDGSSKKSDRSDDKREETEVGRSRILRKRTHRTYCEDSDNDQPNIHCTFHNIRDSSDTEQNTLMKHTRQSFRRIIRNPIEESSGDEDIDEDSQNLRFIAKRKENKYLFSKNNQTKKSKKDDRSKIKNSTARSSMDHKSRSSRLKYYSSSRNKHLNLKPNGKASSMLIKQLAYRYSTSDTTSTSSSTSSDSDSSSDSTSTSSSLSTTSSSSSSSSTSSSSTTTSSSSSLNSTIDVHSSTKLKCKKKKKTFFNDKINKKNYSSKSEKSKNKSDKKHSKSKKKNVN